MIPGTFRKWQLFCSFLLYVPDTLENRKIDPQEIAVLPVNASAGGVGGVELPGYQKSLLFGPVNQRKQIL